MHSSNKSKINEFFAGFLIALIKTLLSTKNVLSFFPDSFIHLCLNLMSNRIDINVFKFFLQSFCNFFSIQFLKNDFIIKVDNQELRTVIDCHLFANTRRDDESPGLIYCYNFHRDR